MRSYQNKSQTGRINKTVQTNKYASDINKVQWISQEKGKKKTLFYPRYSTTMSLLRLKSFKFHTKSSSWFTDTWFGLCKGICIWAPSVLLVQCKRLYVDNFTLLLVSLGDSGWSGSLGLCCGLLKPRLLTAWFRFNSVTSGFGLGFDLMGMSFPSTWFVNTNVTCNVFIDREKLSEASKLPIPQCLA